MDVQHRTGFPFIAREHGLDKVDISVLVADDHAQATPIAAGSYR